MLLALNYGLIDSNQLLTLGKSINGIFSSFDPSKDPYVLAPFVTRAAQSYKLYSQAYEREAKNPYTKLLEGADKVRDSSFFGYRDYVGSCIYSEEVNVQEAARRLVEVIYKHGWGAAYFGYKAETAALTKIINETRDYFLADVELVGAMTRFQHLEQKEIAFEEVQKSSATRPTQGLPTLVEARPKLIDALRKLINMVDNHYSANPSDTVLMGYVKALNELINLTMSTARAAETREKNKKAGEVTPPAA